jgi:alkaline phosphatase D
MDKNVLAMYRDIPVLAQWDDHEVFNNWWPGEPMDDRAELVAKKYADKNDLILAARGAKAFDEYMPMRFAPAEPGRVYRKVSYGPLLVVVMLDMRSYRGPNGENKQTAYGPDAYFLGPTQIAWLKRELLSSKATWKVIAADMPISILVPFDTQKKWGWEAIAQADDGKPLGRELEIADLLSFIKRAGVVNTVWLTADVHYTAAHYYDPNKAQFQDFEPFWEFVSGPLSAGSSPPKPLDATFGPQLMYAKGSTDEMGPSPSPVVGCQFFGHVAIDGRTEQMTVTLKDLDNTSLWSKTIDPRRV